MKKAAEAFRSIGEVSQLVGVAPHVLRYWESQFPLFSPVKRRDGRRYYRPDDVKLAAGLCELLREEGQSIRGVKKQMQADRGAALKARGAARLGGAIADDPKVPQPTEAATPEPVTALPLEPRPIEAPPAPAEALAEKRPAPTARKRKATTTDTLPLFPELADAAASDDSSNLEMVEPAPPTVDWLGRLVGICTGLQDRPAIPADVAAEQLARLAKARRALAG